MLDDKSILVTSGTGSFGKKFVKTVLERHDPKRVIVFSRDELKQFDMMQTLNDKRMRYFIGDIRDSPRLDMAMQDVDVVVHAFFQNNDFIETGLNEVGRPVEDDFEYNSGNNSEFFSVERLQEILTSVTPFDD